MTITMIMKMGRRAVTSRHGSVYSKSRREAKEAKRTTRHTPNLWITKERDDLTKA